jgi:hypothetical protein
MLSGTSELVRVAAYEALLDRGPNDAVIRSAPSKDFVVDVVQTDRDYAIYATLTGQPKIVLFGRNIPVRLPMFYCASDELVTVHAPEGKDRLSVYRKIPRSGKMSDTFQVEPQALDLIRTLGATPELTPEGEVRGLGLTYCQVVGVVQALCKGGHIPASFVLQRAPEVRTIYMATSALGRSDDPEED